MGSVLESRLRVRSVSLGGDSADRLPPKREILWPRAKTSRATESKFTMTATQMLLVEGPALPPSEWKSLVSPQRMCVKDRNKGREKKKKATHKICWGKVG